MYVWGGEVPPPPTPRGNKISASASRNLKVYMEELPLWCNRISGVLGALGCRFNLWPGTVG